VSFCTNLESTDDTVLGVPLLLLGGAWGEGLIGPRPHFESDEKRFFVRNLSSPAWLLPFMLSRCSAKRHPSYAPDPCGHT
jgi:hypothetical protein